MSSNPFKPAVREQARGRIAFVGPTGSGKTYTALTVARELGGRIAVIDSEPGTVAKYADLFQFDWASPPDHHPRHWLELMARAEDHGYEVLVLDSYSAPWSGKGGVLELVDKVSVKFHGNKFAAWAEGTKWHLALVEAIQRSPCHVLCTLRAKTAWVIEKDGRGKDKPVEVGMEPVQRDGIEYEFDFAFRMDQANNCWATKWRDPAFAEYLEHQPGADLGQRLRRWLDHGAAASPPPPRPELPVDVEPAPPQRGGGGRRTSPTAGREPQRREPVPAQPPPATPAGMEYREETTRLSEQERRRLYDAIKEAGLSVLNGGPGKPILVQLLPAMKEKLRLPPEGPPVDARKIERGMFDVLLPLLEQEAALRRAEQKDDLPGTVPPPAATPQPPPEPLADLPYGEPEDENQDQGAIPF